MPKTTVDVDPELLAAAKARLGTSTIKETINAALREVAERGEREQAIDEVAAMVRNGDLDWNVLDDKQNYRVTAPSVASEDTSSSVEVEGAQVSGVVDQVFPVGGDAGHRDFGPVQFKSVSLSPETLGRIPAKLTWYTPNQFVANLNRHLALVRAALENVPSSEVLSAVADLQVHDPSMGSGVFLQAALDLAQHRVTAGDIREMREALHRLQLHYSPLGAHPDDEAKHVLQSVDAVLEDLEALASTANEAAE
ncbi:type II toxin-antitoxin system VapB family antitoxin [Streptomyces sp. SID4946]|uniref:type II toxin-antitoxin system VapB family antitoxin n=1 Tax=Streptomyces sp. LamerLS-31b TaxID=1839765 RepID=UPI000D1BF680|nr:MULTISPECIES: type II toxin-antitoxin system VapB family antitoxin [unclassified Streptomyces]MYQ91488.1 type II toxin-antitoxin system VapB family antitoxin [Streptomyces sp. SID4946]